MQSWQLKLKNWMSYYKQIIHWNTTLPSESYREQERAKKCIELLQTKVNVKIILDIYQKCVIIDKQLVWYGSIGLFDYIDSNDTIMRVESRELVEELGVSIHQSTLQAKHR